MFLGDFEGPNFCRNNSVAYERQEIALAKPQKSKAGTVWRGLAEVMGMPLEDAQKMFQVSAFDLPRRAVDECGLRFVLCESWLPCSEQEKASGGVPTEADMLAVKDEMPEMLFRDNPCVL